MRKQQPAEDARGDDLLDYWKSPDGHRRRRNGNLSMVASWAAFMPSMVVWFSTFVLELVFGVHWLRSDDWNRLVAFAGAVSLAGVCLGMAAMFFGRRGGGLLILFLNATAFALAPSFFTAR
jgi:hypothetical protein